jgi:hypothetical protein
VTQGTCRCRHNEDADTGKFVEMEDSDTDSYVAVGELVAADYTAETIGDGTGAGEQMVWVNLKSVKKADTILPFEVRGADGKVICRTLGEAFSSNKGVLWLRSDTNLTQPDGCTTVK